jgi:hypothetical protein
LIPQRGDFGPHFGVGVPAHVLSDNLRRFDPIPIVLQRHRDRFMTKPLGDQFHVRTHVDVLDRKRVTKAMWAKGVRERFIFLRPLGHGVYSPA